jgi:DNA-binding response OmpR family regulator
MNSNANPIEVAIVEDDGFLREELAHFLDANRYLTHQLNSGLALDDLLLKRKIEIILLDLNLPGASGFEIAKKIRAVHPEIGIIMLTARTSLPDRVKGYESGADIYLPKPTPPQELLAAINSLAKRLSNNALNGWTLHLHSSQLISPKGNERLPLIAIECLLLKALAQAENNSLESESICEILSEQLAVELMTKRALENVVSRFRKKVLPFIDSDTDQIIQSIRGSGYRLCLPLTIENN